MNKKGAVFHWIVFGILAALAIFLMSTKTSFVTTELKGDWQMDFLKNNYLEAEKAKLKTTIAAQEIGKKTAIELGKKGGHLIASPCGQHQGKNLWNGPGQACFPNINESLEKYAIQEFQAKGKKMFNISYADDDFLGTGEEKTIKTSNANYTYKEEFIINIKYSFDDYKEIIKQAQILLTKCKPQENLQACIKLPNEWKIGNCQTSQAISGRILSFCVKATSELAIEHHFALDFTSNQQVSNT